jgi:hypothetical protein
VELYFFLYTTQLSQSYHVLTLVYGYRFSENCTIREVSVMINARCQCTWCPRDTRDLRTQNARFVHTARRACSARCVASAKNLLKQNNRIRFRIVITWLTMQFEITGIYRARRAKPLVITSPCRSHSRAHAHSLRLYAMLRLRVYAGIETILEIYRILWTQYGMQ